MSTCSTAWGERRPSAWACQLHPSFCPFVLPVLKPCHCPRPCNVTRHLLPCSIPPDMDSDTSLLPVMVCMVSNFQLFHFSLARSSCARVLEYGSCKQYRLEFCVSLVFNPARLTGVCLLSTFNGMTDRHSGASVYQLAVFYLYPTWVCFFISTLFWRIHHIFFVPFFFLIASLICPRDWYILCFLVTELLKHIHLVNPLLGCVCVCARWCLCVCTCTRVLVHLLSHMLLPSRFSNPQDISIGVLSSWCWCHFTTESCIPASLPFLP